MNMIDRPATGEAPQTMIGPGGGWAVPLAALAVALLAWGVLFAGEIVAAVAVWDNSTAYNHCWLILPIALWLGWQRRARLVGLVPRPSARGSGCWRDAGWTPRPIRRTSPRRRNSSTTTWTDSTSRARETRPGGNGTTSTW